MIQQLSASLIPLLTAGLLLAAFRKNVDVFSAFTEGASHGMQMILRIAPNIIGLLVAVQMLIASGAVELFAGWLSPVLTLLGVPGELLPLVLLRPISGNGSLSVLKGLMDTYGVDSLVATAAAVILTSTETTLYTAGVYFGSVGATKTRGVIWAALCADLTAVLVACYLVFGRL